MTAPRDWKALVAGRAKAAGADLPQHTIDELAAHLEDIYTEAVRTGAPDAQALSPGRNRTGGIGAHHRAAATIATAGGATAQRGLDRAGDDRPHRRRPLCLAPMAAVAVLRRNRDPYPRARRRRRDRDLQHCRHRAAASVAIPPAAGAGLDLGEQCGEGAPEGEALAGQLHGLPEYADRLFRGGRVVASGGESR